MPKASYSLHRTNQLAVYEWLQTLKLPDGFSSNLATCVDSTSSKLIGMKSHDCHIFMQFLLPVAFMFLPSCHWKALTELSVFFRNLCSTSLRVDKICEMENSIVLTLCKLERFFPPALFDCMEHLPVHLPYETRLGGPVQYRWMYPFERFLNHLKSKMKNKRYVEGSIADAYMLEESTHFASFYFDDDVHSRRTRIGRNLNDGGIDPNMPITLSIFNRPGRLMGRRTTRYLSVEERFAAHQYVLLNCEEVQPILRLYENGLRLYNPGCTDQDVDDDFLTHWDKCALTWQKETIIQMQQTQPELEQATAWYEATGGVKKGGYVFGFGSDTQHYFPEVARQKKSRNGESSSHATCGEKFEQLDQTNKEILENQKKIMGLLQGIYSAHPELVESVAPTADSNQSGDVGLDNIAPTADSNQSGDVGLDNLSMDDDTQSPT
nr:uncharacterized protein LOC109190933 [Ipomoea trifida]